MTRFRSKRTKIEVFKKDINFVSVIEETSLNKIGCKKRIQKSTLKIWYKGFVFVVVFVSRKKKSITKL